MLILLITILLIIIYLYAIYPNTSRKDSFKPYEQVYIAHRGLFNNKDIPENSIVAFKKAVSNNYGIELDCQITTDDKIVVFHDGNLKRMTGIDKMLCDCSYDELQQYHLLNTKHTIPLFCDVLKVLNKDTPLIVEIKTEGRNIETTKRVVQMLKEYDGTYNIESFNPFVVKYLKKHEPQIIRGQLSYNYLKDKESKHNFIIKFILTNLFFNFINKPDYIAYDINGMNNLSFKIVSKLFKGECIAWTNKSQQDIEKASKYCKVFIFDSFIPNKNNNH